MHRVAHMDELIHGCPLVELIIVCGRLALWDCRLWLSCGRQWNNISSAFLRFTQIEGFIKHKKERYILWESN